MLLSGKAKRLFWRVKCDFCDKDFYLVGPRKSEDFSVLRLAPEGVEFSGVVSLATLNVKKR